MDVDLIEAAATIKQLERALDRANTRIRELELVAQTANLRLSEANDRADAFEAQALRFQIEAMMTAAQDRAGGAQSSAGIADYPPLPSKRTAADLCGRDCQE